MIWCLSTFLTSKPITVLKKQKTPTGITPDFPQLPESSLVHGAGACEPVIPCNGLYTLLDKDTLICHFSLHLFRVLPLTPCAPPYRLVLLLFVLPLDLYTPLPHSPHYHKCKFTSFSTSWELFADNNSVCSRYYPKVWYIVNAQLIGVEWMNWW